jgi:hypothetical protein
MIVGLSAATGFAGGMPPMYVVVEKVVLAPSDSQPEAIQIWGWFTRMQPQRTDEKFSKPTYGYIYLGAGCAADAPKWKEAAGAGKAVVVGCCYQAGDFLKVPIHKPGDEVSKPDADYPKNQLCLYETLFADKDFRDLPYVKALLAAAHVKPVTGDVMAKFITDAVFTGLKQDGVSRDVARQIGKNPDFLGKCLLCRPTQMAFEDYSRLPIQPEGKGLKEDMQKRLTSTEAQTRHEALRELVQNYMEQAYAKSKMSDDERQAMRAAIDDQRKAGLGTSFPRGQKFCPSCDGAACVLRR